MLCNKCGHSQIQHANGMGGNGERCFYPGCPCAVFVPPGDADAYEGFSRGERLAAQTWDAAKAEGRREARPNPVVMFKSYERNNSVLLFDSGLAFVPSGLYSQSELEEISRKLEKQKV